MMEQTEKRRVFSLNLCAYLRSRGLKPIDKGIDEGTGLVYWIFPECGSVINEYRRDMGTQSFIREFKNVKQEARELTNYAKHLT